MAIAWGAVFTLTFLILIGPAIYFCQQLLENNNNKDSNTTTNNNDTKESNLIHDNNSNNNVTHNNNNNNEHDENNTNQETPPTREILSSQQYLFGLIGYAIGIGNVWRFPYIISQNGGAAAVVAYLICLVLVAFPLFLYEMIVGQYVRKAGIMCYETIRPRWESIGWAQLLLLCFCLSYYQVVVAYTLPYIVGSCVDPLPWMQEGASSYWFDTLLSVCTEESPCENGLGPIQWQLGWSLLIIWIICYLAVSFGRNILSKVTYVTVIMPVVLMTLLVIRTAFLEGARDGIMYYIGKFEASQLLKLEVWAAACSQIFFSLSPGFGTAIMYSSFSHPKEDVYKTSVIVASTNSLFSLFGGFAIFSIVGHIAVKEGRAVEDVASNSGTGLAFITIAESMQYFGSAQNIVSVLFFIMLLTLGLDSSFAWIETIVGHCEDLLAKKQMEHYFPTWKLTLIMSVVLFVMGLPYCTRMGDQILGVVDHFAGTMFLLIISFLESIMLNLDFTWERLTHALRTATKGNPGTPDGRELFPVGLCKFDFSISVPVVTLFLGGYILYFDFTNPFGNYSKELLRVGWTVLTLLILVASLTLWKRDNGTLPAIPAVDDQEEEEEVQVKQEGAVVENKNAAATTEESNSQYNILV